MSINGEPNVFKITDGILLPATKEAYERDIRVTKSLGFNTLRKHIKIEPRAFYAYCDKVGVMVLQDIPSCRTDQDAWDIQYGNKRYGFYRQELKDIIDHLRNHPSIVMWIPFNEGWGQFSADKVYEHFKKLEPNYLFDATSGWFHQTKSDFDSLHIYFRNINPRINNINHPVFISEFGGYSYKLNAHSFNLTHTYGYRNVNSKIQTTRQRFNFIV